MWGLGCRSGELAAGGVVRWASKGRGRTGADTKVQSLSSWSSRERGGRAVRARGRCAVCVCGCGCGCVRGVSGCGSLRDAQERRQRPRDGAGGSGGPPLWRPLEGRGEAPGSAPGRAGTRRRASVFLVSPSGQIQCHVCEEYNNFNCFNPVNCDAGDIYCVTAAVRECRAGPRTARSGGFPAAPRGSEPSGQPGSALGNRAWGAGGSGPGRAALGSRDPPSVRPRLPPGILVRYIYVSRQCTKSCPVIPAAEVVSKPFVLVKPTPFLFAMCCQRSLCNIHSPFINDTELDYRGAGQARGGHAGLVLLLSLAAASLALRLC